MSWLLSSPQYEEIKHIIGGFVEDYGITYPVDPFALLRTLRVTVTEHHGDFTGHGHGVHTEDGYTVLEPFTHGNGYATHLNADKPLNRRRFTAAHEIGHIVLDHFRPSCTLTNDEQEGAAQFFAGYLLAPDVRVLALPECTVDAIAAAFVLSGPAAQNTFRRAMRTRNRPPVQTLYDTQLSAAEYHPLLRRLRQAASDR